MSDQAASPALVVACGGPKCPTCGHYLHVHREGLTHLNGIPLNSCECCEGPQAEASSHE